AFLQEAAPYGIVVEPGGAMDVSGTQFTRTPGNASRTQILVQSNGQISTSDNTTFGLHGLVLNEGSTSSIRRSIFNTSTTIHSGANIDISGNHFNQSQVFA
ncbi:hypothetical protein AB1L30_00455, partial [Bremerella sp. JC817]|uniref:hypothetical protein n=1 Tax=Bremerella sp. JC817 TaxID=3231756 RepID=UPI0034596158